ncbi:unnamed protein product [Amoebophrya sp. A25]|nr:unnamed protein product [Amoebophrya sp. A25]|eukprot:GSA25T00013904001.1
MSSSSSSLSGQRAYTVGDVVEFRTKVLAPHQPRHFYPYSHRYNSQPSYTFTAWQAGAIVGVLKKADHPQQSGQTLRIIGLSDTKGNDSGAGSASSRNYKKTTGQVVEVNTDDGCVRFFTRGISGNSAAPRSVVNIERRWENYALAEDAPADVEVIPEETPLRSAGSVVLMQSGKFVDESSAVASSSEFENVLFTGNQAAAASYIGTLQRSTRVAEKKQMQPQDTTLKARFDNYSAAIRCGSGGGNTTIRVKGFELPPSLFNERRAQEPFLPQYKFKADSSPCSLSFIPRLPGNRSWTEARKFHKLISYETGLELRAKIEVESDGKRSEQLLLSGVKKHLEGMAEDVFSTAVADLTVCASINIIPECRTVGLTAQLSEDTLEGRYHQPLETNDEGCEQEQEDEFSDDEVNNEDPDNGFTIPDNRADKLAPLPKKWAKAKALQLRPDQRRALGWMLQRESDPEPVEIHQRQLINMGDLLPSEKASKLVTKPYGLEFDLRYSYPIRGGVLADKVGYGKTATLLALIASGKDGDRDSLETRREIGCAGA